MKRTGADVYDLIPRWGRLSGIGIMILYLGLLIFMAMAGVALADQAVEMPKGPAPKVEANLDKVGEETFMKVPEGVEKKLLPPNHPPIDQIPPMPMPKFNENKSSSPKEKGYMILHNSETNENITPPEPSSPGPTKGEGYDGADGGSPFDITDPLLVPLSMTGNMSLITGTGTAPWRMNAKLVIRLGTAYAVCSGSMIDAKTVLTAGHCVYNRDTDFGAVGWVNEIWVYPGWDGNANQWAPPPTTINPYGYGHSNSFATWSGWTSSGDWNNDIGLVRIDRPVGVLTGWYSWSADGTCDERKAQTYHNASYPAEDCGTTGLHNGSDMYYWYGNFDYCPEWNRLGLSTPVHGCFGAIWGGMSGSSTYYIDGSTRYIHAVTSTSNRYDYAEYTRLWSAFTTYMTGTFIPNCRGSSFDMAPLHMVAEPATINAGSSTTTLNHLATNATNGTANDTWYYGVYLSDNDNVTTSDTLLSRQFYGWNFPAMGSVTVNMVQVTIPKDTPTGDYWLGLVYDSATDANSSNNNTKGWDAAPIHVNAMPDLVIQSITTSPLSPTNDYSVDVTVTIENEGGAAAGHSFWVDIFKDLSTPPVPAGGLTGDGYCSFTDLAAGATATCTRTVYYPNPGTGTYHIYATVDTNLQATESFEDNNVGGPRNIIVDATLPTVSAFTISQDLGNFLKLNVTSFTASDDYSLAGYMVTESSTPPAAGAVGWSATPPASYTLSSFSGSKTLYAWAKDWVGNVSSFRSATITLDQPVRIHGGALYTSLQAAYNAVSGSSATIDAWATLLSGNVTFNDTHAITLNGGYDKLFGSATGVTTVDGAFTVGSGSVIVDRVAIR